MAAAATVGRERNSVTPPPACPDGEHDYAFQRGRPGDVPRDVPLCEQPRRMACKRCPAFLVLPCETSRSKACAPCGARYRRRVQTVMAEGSAPGAGTTLVVTLTAPGTRRHRDLTRPGSPWCACTDEGGVDLAAWNGRQGERWNRFMQALRRSGLLGDVLEYGRAVEVQDGKRREDGVGRMALHEHVLLRSSTVVRVDEPLVAQLRALAIEHGYGHALTVDRAAVSEDGRARLAAWYAAKYVAKAADVRDEVPWARRDLVLADGTPRCNRQTGEILRSPWSYRTWTASRGWGCSMRAVRDAQRAWRRLSPEAEVRLAASVVGGGSGTFLPRPPGDSDVLEPRPD